MQTADRLLLSLFMLMFLIVLLKRAEPAQAMPLIKADYPVCVTIHTAPLGPQPTAKDPHPRMPDSA